VFTGTSCKIIICYILQIRIRKRKINKWLGKQKNFLTGFISEPKRHLKMLLTMLALVCFVVALARPQIVGEKVDLNSAGVFIALMVDVSQSMLAEDIKPNRLSFMKRELNHLLDMSQGDQVALVAFAHQAVLIAPFTQDVSAIKSYLKDVSPDYFTHQGTHFSRAFDLVHKAFQGVRSKKYQTSVKIVIVASDGEDHSSQTKAAIKKLLNQDIRIFTLSFGTKKGGVIPVRNNQGEVIEYKKDTKGQLVVSQLNDADLKNFAKLGKGAYYHMTYGGEGVAQLKDSISQLEKTIFETSSVIKNKEIYFWFLIVGFIFAFCELILSDRSFKYKGEK